jgi:nucleoside-diphosphate-sugar epimerase
VTRILITGGGGFLGRNLAAHLCERKDCETTIAGREDSPEELRGKLLASEVIFHLAGVNRPQGANDCEAGNAKLTAQLCQFLRERLAIAYTIFRPTLIYGAGRDRNIADIARFVRRFGVFPILGKGIGLRQPVHAADLAEACLLAVDSSASFNRVYNLSGGETLTYRQMVERVFQAMGKRGRVVSLPQPYSGSPSA